MQSSKWACHRTNVDGIFTYLFFMIELIIVIKAMLVKLLA